MATEIVHPLVSDLAQAVDPNFNVIPIPGFDELMDAILKHCDRQPLYATAKSMQPQSGHIGHLPFEMQPVEGSTLEELDWPRVQKELTIYCSGMGISVPSVVSREWLTEQLSALDLVTMRGDKINATVAGYLLFAQDPNRRVKSLVTLLSSSGQIERKLNGNLWTQLESIANLLEEVNRPFIVKGSTSEFVYPYPKIALRELAANALVHRNYEQDGQMSIEIEKEFIRFINPGGLIEEVAEKAQPSLQEKIEMGVRGITGYRNPILADLLCGTGKIEKKGSGLPDVHQAVTKNGGKLRFGPLSDANTCFCAVIFGRQESVDKSTRTATPATNRSTYFTNLLEIIELPEIAYTGVIDDSILRGISKDVMPPFARAQQGKILTFANLEDSALPFSNLILPGSVEKVKVESYLVPHADKRALVALMNGCLYRTMNDRELVVDSDRKRAYFPRTSEGPREIRYQASFRQATRTVTKPFISRSTQRVLYWEHEAIWFAFEFFRSTWALRILPGYVFTVDGREELLHHRRVGALATRKAARDFNQQVYNDLVFWSWILAKGEHSFSIWTGGQPISTLSSLASCQLEVPSEADLPFHPLPSRMHFDIENLEKEIADETEADLGGS
ncbi:MAG: ATP-binding protein [Terriglobia bacterium]